MLPVVITMSLKQKQPINIICSHVDEINMCVSICTETSSRLDKTMAVRVSSSSVSALGRMSGERSHTNTQIFLCNRTFCCRTRLDFINVFSEIEVTFIF